MSSPASWEGPEPKGHAYDFLSFNADLTPEQLIRRRRDWLRAAIDERDSWMKDSREMQNLPQQVLYLMNDQWPTRRPTYKAAPINNRLLRSMEQTVAILTDLRPTYEVKSQDDTFSDQADLLTKCIKAWWLQNDVDFQLAMAIIYAYLGTGFLRIVWNKNLCHGAGDFQVYPCSPYDIGPIGPTHQFQEWEGCIYEAIRNVAWFRRMFPGPGSSVQPDLGLSRYAKPMQRPGPMGTLNFDLLSPQMQRWVGTPREFGESPVAQAWYREFWVKDYCVASETKVLTADLRWIRADELSLGDELIGCDEEAATSTKSKRSNRNRCRWVRRSKVEALSRLIEPCVKITTDKGEVICSTQHRWLARNKNAKYDDLHHNGPRKRQIGSINYNYDWTFAIDLKPGDTIAYFAKPWTTDTSRDGGYLAGLYDGEGDSGNYDVHFAQKPRPDHGQDSVLERGLRLLADRGYETHSSPNKNSGTVSVRINGGRPEALRFLGSIRPERLLKQAHKIWEGKLLMAKGAIAAKVLSVEEVGEREVIGLRTTTKTFIADGFVSHNSVNTSRNIIQMGTPGTNWAYDVKPGMPLYPRGRVIITGGAELHVLYDGPNFYWHGKFPFVAIRLKPVPWQFHGLSELMTKIPQQDIINTILAGTLDMIKKAINPPLLFPDNAFSDAIKNTLDPNMPNAKIGYNPMAPQIPEYQSPPILPSYVQQTLQYAQAEMDDDSGLLDLQAMSRKKATPAGDTLEQLKETQQTIMRLRGRYIEMAIGDMGEQMTPNIIQFWTLNRRMWMFGRAGVTYQDVWDSREATMIPFGRNPIEHARVFSFQTVPGSMLNLTQGDQRMLAMALRRQGDMDRQTLYQQLDLDKLYEQVTKNLKQEGIENAQNQMAMAAAAQGMGAPPPIPGNAPPQPGFVPVHRGKGTDNPQNLLKPS